MLEELSKQKRHHKKWMHNRKFLSAIDDEFSDWMVVVAFYTALHAIEALFAHDGVTESIDHYSRNQILKGYKRYDQIWRHYRPLRDAAQAARYQCGDDSWVPVADVKGRLIGHHLASLGQSVSKLIGEEESVGPIKFKSES